MIKIINYHRSISTLTRKFINYFGLLRFPLPDLGEKIKEGRVKKLYVREGDRITQFQKLADVQSDKQFTQISSPEEGLIKKIYYHEDQTCQVGDIFLDIETQSDVTSQPAAKKVTGIEAPKMKPVEQPSVNNDEVLASATVKMWARQHKINLEQVVGTGRKGRILKQDIIYFIQNRKNQPLKPKIIEQPKVFVSDEITKVRMTETQKQRQKMATYSATIPHLFFEESFDVTNVLPIVQASNNRNQPVSLSSILIKAFSMALSVHPKVNSVYHLGNQFKYQVVGEQNVLLPIYGKLGLGYSLLSRLQRQSIMGIQYRLNSIGEGQVQSSKVNQMISRATICLSHIGTAGLMTMNPPIIGESVCHASIGQVRDVTIFNKGKQERRKKVSVVIGADHRVLDGASVARFGKTWQQYSENPTTAFINMI